MTDNANSIEAANKLNTNVNLENNNQIDDFVKSKTLECLTSSTIKDNKGIRLNIPEAIEKIDLLQAATKDTLFKDNFKNIIDTLNNSSNPYFNSIAEIKPGLEKLLKIALEKTNTEREIKITLNNKSAAKPFNLENPFSAKQIKKIPTIDKKEAVEDDAKKKEKKGWSKIFGIVG